MDPFQGLLAQASASGVPGGGPVREDDGDRARRWVHVPHDQLTDQVGPLSRLEPGEAGIVLVEDLDRYRRRPYHRQKIALVLANLRHFALEQARRGVRVRYEHAPGSTRDRLREVAGAVGPLTVMEPAERELRGDLAPLVREGVLQVVPHEGWLTTEADFRESHPKGPPWRMDRFYRHVRRRTGILMEGGSPVGGKYSFDAENRRGWKGDPPAPAPPTFPRDPVKEAVRELVDGEFADHPGSVDLGRLPATLEDTEALWTWALEACMEHFGPYQDAMSEGSASLFHTRISALMNLHRILPGRVLEDVLGRAFPLASLEGFVRQILGWREYVRHVHRETDGFRRLPLEDGTREGLQGVTVDPAGAPSHLGAGAPLPPAYWPGAPSGLRCLDRVVSDVWEEGYGHHITRLMVLSNLGMLLDVSPRELTDWFWVAYTDAWDWVVEPNVLGMGTFAVGDLMTTKPYIAGAAYINRMGDSCGRCAFNPRTTCPITRLYWAYLGRHREALEGNRRMAIPLNSLSRRSSEQQEEDRRIFNLVSDLLSSGKALTPESLKES